MKLAERSNFTLLVRGFFNAQINIEGVAIN